MKFLTTIIRWFVGLLFIVSGLVKTIDPIGFSYKLEEYFSPQVFDIPFLHEYALVLSVFFVIFEVMLGVLLLLGVWKRFTLSSLLILIVFFTFLTFYSAYFNKVTDCGCFGDALKLEPWESFGKDVVLLVLIIFLTFNYKYIRRYIAKPYTYVFAGISFIFCCFLAFKGISYLPVVDFRPYAVGKSIPEGMKTAQELGKQPTVIVMQYQLKNRLNGKVIHVDEDAYISNRNYWKEDSPWELIEAQDKVMKKGYEPPIHDFYIDCMEEGDVTDQVLNEPEVILLVTPLPSIANSKGLEKVSEWAKEIKSLGIPMYSLASETIEIDGVPTCLMDATTLKTMIRSNPGVLFLKKGVVQAKYPWRSLPTLQETKKDFN